MSDSERGWKQLANGDVQITMNRDDYNHLLLALGYAAGAALGTGDRTTVDVLFRLVNRLNAGNPNYTPYKVSEC